jgi:hypothetical protein
MEEGKDQSMEEWERTQSESMDRTKTWNGD